MTEINSLAKSHKTNLKQTHQTSTATRIVCYLAGITVILVIVHLILQYLNMNVFRQQNGQIFELSNRFDLDDESSVPTWFSQFLFLAISASAFFAAWLSRQKSVKRLWSFIGFLGLLATIDEVATLHEFILQTLHVTFFNDASPTWMQNAWILVMPIIMTGFLWVSWRMWRLLPKKTFGLFVFAGVVFIAGAMAVDMATSMIDRNTFTHQGIMVAIEEAMELFGCIIALYAIVEYIESSYGKIIHKSIHFISLNKD